MPQVVQPLWLGKLDMPPAPAHWSGVRITLVVAPFWPSITERWDQIDTAAAGTPHWATARRVVMMQAGEWYRLSRQQAPPFPRAVDMQGMELSKWTSLVLHEAGTAFAHMETWAAQHASGSPHAASQFYVASVPCPTEEEDCRLALREGLQRTVAAAGSARLHFFDLAQLALAPPDERVHGHPSLVLSTLVWNLWFTLAFSRGPPPERCLTQHVQFAPVCFAAGMKDAHPGNTMWELFQATPCSYNITHEHT